MNPEQKRGYYTDAYRVAFTAVVTECMRDEQGHTAVVLDQTYFYPESGGQPADTGRLGDYPVIDVTVRESDQAVLHWLAMGVDEPLPAVQTAVAGQIDWPRRFDHMQQHSGQHILSRAFINTAVAETVSFHLGQDVCTIDLELADGGEGELTAVAIAQAEELANHIIWENHPIHIRFVTPAEAHTLPLRKQPEVASDYLRLVDIHAFDLTACGGTHVARTGEVGLLKVVKLEKRKQKWRVSFLCGQRALADYAAKTEIIQALTNELTTAPTELLGSLQKLQEENKTARRTVRQLQTELAHYEVAHYRQTAERVGEMDVMVVAVADKDGTALRSLVQAILTDAPRPTVVLAGGAGEKPFFMCQRTADALGEMNGVLKAGLAVLGSRSGGGTAVVAQGSAPAASLAEVTEALAVMKKAWHTAVL